MECEFTLIVANLHRIEKNKYLMAYKRYIQLCFFSNSTKNTFVDSSAIFRGSKPSNLDHNILFKCTVHFSKLHFCYFEDICYHLLFAGCLFMCFCTVSPYAAQDSLSSVHSCLSINPHGSKC